MFLSLYDPFGARKESGLSFSFSYATYVEINLLSDPLLLDFHAFNFSFLFFPPSWLAFPSPG